MPFATTGEMVVVPPGVVAVPPEVQSGWHTVGEPEQLVTPWASKAYSLFVKTYTTPLATAGAPRVGSPKAVAPTGAVHNEAPLLASKASREFGPPV